MVDPERFFEEKAQEVTGISAADLVGKPSFRAIFPQVADMFRGVKHLIGFNIDYDTQVLHYNLLAYGLERRMPWPSQHHDLMKASKDLLNLQGKQDQKFAKLTELHTVLFGKSFEGAHDALEDVRATFRCAKALHEKGLLWLT
jgi:DNA polymerase-3 subunit epsilon